MIERSVTTIIEQSLAEQAHVVMRNPTMRNRKRRKRGRAGCEDFEAAKEAQTPPAF